MDYFNYIYLTICLYDIGIKQKDVIVGGLVFINANLHKKLNFYASQIKIKSTPVRYIYNRASKLIKNYAYGQCMWT